MKRIFWLLLISLMLLGVATAWGSDPLSATPAATKKESKDFLAAKAAANADAYQKFIKAHPESALMRAFENEMECGGTIVNLGDEKWERRLYLKPKNVEGEIIVLTNEEATKWGLLNSGYIKCFSGKITVYAEPSSWVAVRKQKCWHILAIKE